MNKPHTQEQPQSAGANTSFNPDPARQRDLRQAFGRFGTGVTIVTTQTPHGPIGMTANSFSSVSLDPPLVLWSPAVNSRRHAAFVETAHFCIHVLSADQRVVAEHFATSGDGFDRFDAREGPFGAPTLPGCLAEFHCDTFAVHPAGDHSLVLGMVRSVTMAQCDTPGLLFEQGRFGSFAAAI